MKKGNLKEIKSLENEKENIKLGLDFALKNNLQNLDLGKIILDEKNYANVDSYKTKEQGEFEAHRKYIDIQIMIKGEEIIEVCDIENCSNSRGYSEEKDIEFFEKCNGEIEKVILKENDFVILEPNDAHKPQIQINESVEVKKIVLKISV